jgi:hypothetical protein
MQYIINKKAFLGVENYISSWLYYFSNSFVFKEKFKAIVELIYGLITVVSRQR